MVPRVMEKLNQMTQQCRDLIFMYATYTTYEVKERNVKYVVNTESRSCDCRVWNLSGVPCIHAIAVLIDRRQTLTDFCDQSLSTGTYLKAYEHLMNPVPDVTFWPEFAATEAPDVLPPELRRRAGRPKKARRRQEGETPASMRRSCTLKCSRCFQLGHNKRTCAGGPIAAKKRQTKKTKTQVKFLSFLFNFSSLNDVSLF